MSIIGLAPSPTAKAEHQADCVRILKERLAEAENGEIEALLLIAKHPDGTWSDEHSGVVGYATMIGWLEVIKTSWITKFIAGDR